LLLLFFDCIDTLPIAPVGLVLSCRCPWPCCSSTSSCCSVCSPLLVCRADQCIGPGPESRGFPIPAGNCGPVSSDVYVLDRHVHILYICFIYNYTKRLIIGFSLMNCCYGYLYLSSLISFWASAPKGAMPYHFNTYGHSFCPFVYLSICPSVRLSICLSVHPYIHLYIHPFVPPSPRGLADLASA
jgi:hypothetical protein